MNQFLPSRIDVESRKEWLAGHTGKGKSLINLSLNYLSEILPLIRENRSSGGEGTTRQKCNKRAWPFPGNLECILEVRTCKLWLLQADNWHSFSLFSWISVAVEFPLSAKTARKHKGKCTDGYQLYKENSLFTWYLL